MAFSYAISKKNTPHFPISCKTVFALRSRRTFFFLQPVFYNILYYISVTLGQIAPRARSLPQPLLCTPSHPQAALPAARSNVPSFLFGNDTLLRASVFRHTEKNLSPAARKKNGSPEGARPCPVFPFVPVLPPDGRRAAHRRPNKKRPAVWHARNRGATPQPHALDRTICQMRKRRLSTGRSGAFCSLSDVYLFIPSCTATATATVAPTIGLLPMPMSPIISTCAGTEEEPANCASECILPIVSVMP